jgi:hypothetical protein
MTLTLIPSPIGGTFTFPPTFSSLKGIQQRTQTVYPLDFLLHILCRRFNNFSAFIFALRRRLCAAVARAPIFLFLHFMELFAIQCPAFPSIYYARAWNMSNSAAGHSRDGNKTAVKIVVSKGTKTWPYFIGQMENVEGK